MDILEIIGRSRGLFHEDIQRHSAEVGEALGGARVLLIGGAGSIGKEIGKQLFQRHPAALHVVDLSENNLVELVRDLRSSLGYGAGETLFLPLDMSSIEMRAFLSAQKPYDFVLNLAAMKHVRSEKDEFSLMRMIQTNVLATLETHRHACATGARKYFAVSTDKASNPANLMGATKRIMEDVLFERDGRTLVSTARFANVAFSDGSLLHGFRQRFMARQPLSAPRDVRRYFVTGEESGLLCLASLVLGGQREIFFPKLNAGLDLLSFSTIAERFLQAQGFEAVPVASEEEARARVGELAARRRWPCYFFDSDTSGEKPFEEFHTAGDAVDWARFADIAVIAAPRLGPGEAARVAGFIAAIEGFRARGSWNKAELVAAIAEACPDLDHVDTGRFLDQKM